MWRAGVVLVAILKAISIAAFDIKCVCVGGVLVGGARCVCVRRIKQLPDGCRFAVAWRGSRREYCSWRGSCCEDCSQRTGFCAC